MKQFMILLLGLVLVLAFAGATMAAPVSVNEEGQVSAFAELGGIGVGYGVTDTLTIHVQTPWLLGVAGDVTGKLSDSLYLKVEGVYFLSGLIYGIDGGIYTPLVENDNLAVLLGANVGYASMADVYDLVEGEYISGFGVGGLVEAQYKVSDTMMVYGNLSVT
ncbi:MAG: hypothetical protein ACUVRM_11265 [Bacillota bacterium]